MKANRFNWFALLLGLGLIANCGRPSQGERIYRDACNSCHMEDGNGLAQLIPPFQSTAFETDRKRLVCAVITGINDTVQGHFMPRFKTLNDADLSNVLNYIRSIKARTSPPFIDREVAAIRTECW